MYIVPTGPAQEVNVSVISFEEVVIRWEAPESADQNGVIIDYLVNITIVSTGQSFARTTTTTSLSLNGLQPFTSYVCQVAARTQVGLGPFSTFVSFLTDETGNMMQCMKVNLFMSCD